MNKYITEEKKCRDKLDKAASGMLVLAYVVTLIVVIVWLFKLLNNIEEESSGRNFLIRKEPSYYYEEGEFCYDNYESFIIRGALKIFDIPVKKIKKYALALLITIFISIGSLIISAILIAISKYSFYYRDRSICFASLFYCIFVLAFILSIIFAIILGHYIYKGDYNGFEEFSRCRYLSKGFKKHYNFVFDLKNGLSVPFFCIVITEIFNFIKLITESDD